MKPKGLVSNTCSESAALRQGLSAALDLRSLKGKVLVVTLVPLVFRRKSVIWEL